MSDLVNSTANTSGANARAADGFPAGQALQLVELAKRWGITPEGLLGPFGLSEAQLAEPGVRIAFETLVELTVRTRDLTGEPGLGIYLGLQKHVSAYGFVGFAAMSAATVGEALLQAVELGPSHSTAVGLTLRVEGETAALVVEEHRDMAPIRDVALLSMFVGFRQMTRDLTGRNPGGSVELQIPEPPYFRRFAHVLPEARFDQPLTQLLLPAAALEVPLVRPDKAALNLAREQCLRRLAELGFEGSLPGRVRRALFDGEDLRNIEQVASRLGMSTRTLKRRLAEHGSTFTDLLQEERRLRALHLLRATELTLEEISEQLGYASATSLARAFTRWTGKSPAVYRRQVRRG
ncbi:MAG: AraC family transcriptional regulator [Myxococcales bacterium]|nr:AraC family transcriptional regulator [Myxococcales bacterium]